MTGNPKACRAYARRCVEFARTARMPDVKTQLLEISKNWLKIAVGLERTEALLKV